MDPQIERLLCKRCRPIVEAALEVERTQLAAKLARERLHALGINPDAVDTHISNVPKGSVPATIVVTPPDLFKGRRSSSWRDVPIEQVLRNIRGDISPNELCDKLGIATSVLRRRVQDIIGKPDSGKRWQKNIGYLVKGKAAWDREQNTLRVDKTKGAAMAAVGAPRKLAAKAPMRRKSSKASPTDDELRLHAAGKISIDKLAQKYKCAKSTIYRAVSYYKVRFGADAPHGEPKLASTGNPSNGSNGAKTLPNGVKPPMVNMDKIVNEIVNGN